MTRRPRHGKPADQPRLFDDPPEASNDGTRPTSGRARRAAVEPRTVMVFVCNVCEHARNIDVSVCPCGSESYRPEYR